MTIAKRMQQIQPSPTLAMSAKAKALMAAGVDVIDLSAGEPDFDTPKNVRDACVKALDAGRTHYTPVGGIPELKDAIIRKLKKENNLDYTPDEIIVTCGIKQAIFTCMQVMVNPGDEVIIPAPYWVSYPDQVRIAEGVPVIVPTTEATGLRITPAQMEKAITSQTKMVIITSPSNPTGMVYTAEELKSLITICKQKNIFILSDEIYEYMVYGDTKFVSPLTLDPALKPNALIANGLSKSFAMTGWRVGFAAGPKEIIKAMEIWQSQSLTHITSFVQYAAIEALDGPRDFVTTMRQALGGQLKICVEALRAIPGITCTTPGGAFYAFPNVTHYIGKKAPDGSVMSSSDALATWLLTGAHVATIPGEAFGAPGFLRISYACDAKKMQGGLQRIAAALQKLT